MTQSGSYERQCRAQGVEVPDEAAGGALCLPQNSHNDEKSCQLSASTATRRNCGCTSDCGCAVGLSRWWAQRQSRSLPPKRPDGSIAHSNTADNRTADLESWYKVLMDKQMELSEENGKLRVEVQGLRAKQCKWEALQAVPQSTPRFGSMQVAGPESAAGGTFADRQAPTSLLAQRALGAPVYAKRSNTASSIFNGSVVSKSTTKESNQPEDFDDEWADGLVAEETEVFTTEMQVAASEAFAVGRTASGRPPPSRPSSGFKVEPGLLPSMDVTQADIERLARQVRELSEQFERGEVAAPESTARTGDDIFELTDLSMDDRPMIRAEVHMGSPMAKKPGQRLEEHSNVGHLSDQFVRSVIEPLKDAEEEVGVDGCESTGRVPGRAYTVPAHLPAVVTAPGARRHGRPLIMPRTMPSPIRTSTEPDTFCRCKLPNRCPVTQR